MKSLRLAANFKLNKFSTGKTCWIKPKTNKRSQKNNVLAALSLIMSIFLSEPTGG